MTILAALRTGRLKAGFDSARRRSPYLYWKLRKGLALAEWCHVAVKTKIAGESPAEPYDEEFWAFHETGDWDNFARAAVRHFRPRSVVDIGCGHGSLLSAFSRVSPEVKVRGFDNSRAALAKSKSKGLNVSRFNLADLRGKKLQELAGAVGASDVAVCLEVAEHLPFWHATKLVRLLTACDVVIFSAAHPNQGGVLHVNEQPAEYWIKKFAKEDFLLDGANDAFREDVAALNLPSWYKQNVNVFRRRGR
jgi:SAM-dependent methyltransferase